MNDPNKKKLSRWLNAMYKRQNNTKLIKGENNDRRKI